MTLESCLLHFPPLPASLSLTMAPRVRGPRCWSPAHTSCASLRYTASLTLNQGGEALKNILTPHTHTQTHTYAYTPCSHCVCELLFHVNLQIDSWAPNKTRIKACKSCSTQLCAGRIARVPCMHTWANSQTAKHKCRNTHTHTHSRKLTCTVPPTLLV